MKNHLIGLSLLLVALTILAGCGSDNSDSVDTSQVNAGRELFMTFFRQYAARKGVVIASIGPVKWNTGFQSVWVGAAFFWFFASDAAAEHRWTNGAWHAFALFNGIVGTVSMVVALGLTLYSLALYLQRYGDAVLRGNRAVG